MANLAKPPHGMLLSNSAAPFHRYDAHRRMCDFTRQLSGFFVAIGLTLREKRSGAARAPIL
jgi:hypothetical protein